MDPLLLVIIKASMLFVQLFSGRSAGIFLNPEKPNANRTLSANFHFESTYCIYYDVCQSFVDFSCDVGKSVVSECSG